MKKINQFVAFVMVLALVLIPTEISAHSGRTIMAQLSRQKFDVFIMN